MTWLVPLATHGLVAVVFWYLGFTAHRVFTID